MTKKEFIEKITNNGWLWKEGIAVKLKNESVHFVAEEALEQGQKLIDSLGSNDVVHMTRVVGYYSRVHNWNPSKLGELKDRQAGNYSLNEPKKESVTF